MRFSLCTGVALVVATAASAQSSLLLSGDVGSFPGICAIDLDGGTPGNPAVVLAGAFIGPTPLFPVNPGDTRVLYVGLAQPLVPFGGLFDPNGHYATPVLPIPNDPSLLDATLYLQGFEITGSPLIGPISQPHPARMARAATFHSRGVRFATRRSNASVIERRDHSMLLLGGGSGTLWAQIPTDTTEIYDPLLDAFSAGPTMLAARTFQTVTALQDGRYLIVGGIGASGTPTDAVEIYDPTADAFVPAANLALARYAHTALLLTDGRVLVIGGMTLYDITQPSQLALSALRSTEIYDPSTDSWSPGPFLLRPRAGHACMPLASGKVLVAGGISGNGVRPTIERACEIYDPTTNTFGSTRSMSFPRAFAAMTPLGNDRYLLAGGNSEFDLPGRIGDVTKTAEIFEAATETWTDAGSMVTGRAMFHAVMLPDGSVLHMGGGAGDLATPLASDSCEFYAPTTNTWSGGTRMTGPRGAYALLQSRIGQVHLIGGFAGPLAMSLDTTDWFYH